MIVASYEVKARALCRVETRSDSQKLCVMVWIITIPQSSYIEDVIPHVIVLRSET